MYEVRKSGFDDLSGGNAAGADSGSFDRSVDNDLDPLEVGEETAQGFADDLRTGTARPLDLPASFIFDPGDDPFVAYRAHFCHNECPVLQL